MTEHHTANLDRISKSIYPLRILGFALFSVSYLLSQARLGLDIDGWGVLGLSACILYPHFMFLLYLRRQHRRTEQVHMILDMGLQGIMFALVYYSPAVLPYLIANAAANFALGGLKQTLQALGFSAFLAILAGVVRQQGFVLDIQAVELIGPYFYLSAVVGFMGFLAYTTGHHSHQANLRQASILRRKKAAEELAGVDYLTGLSNRRAIISRMESADNGRRQHDVLNTVLMIDLDHFKKINDEHGHDHGDQVLVQVGNILRDSLRQTDLVARWGGEEFLVLMPRTNAEEGLLVAEKLRNSIADQSITHEKVIHRVTATIGVSSCALDVSFEEAVRRADEALYRGKQQGRNCVVRAGSR